MTDKIAVILSGCGVYDGSEVHEASAACSAISRAGKKAVFYAPDKDQYHMVNHVTSEDDKETKRNVLVESGRIARGTVLPLADLNVEDIDAIIIPGGFGAAKNLCSFATSSEPQVDENVARVLRECVANGKPIGLCCIAPIVAALVLAKEDGMSLKMTLGRRSGEGWPYAATIDKAVEFGITHVEMDVEEVCIDETNKIVTSPAFMYDAQFHQVHDGVAKMVESVIALL